MASLLRPGSRSFSRARDGPAALATRSSAAAPWAAIRMLSTVTTEDFIKQVFNDPHERLQGEIQPSSSSSCRDGRGSTPTTSAELKSSPATVIGETKASSMIQDAYSNISPDSPEGSQGQDAGKAVVRRVFVPHEKPLIRRLAVEAKKGSRLVRASAPSYTWSETPEAVFSRPRTVVFRGLPPETQTRDIIQAINEATEAAELSHRADRISDVRFLPHSGDGKFLTAKVEFLHPDGARAVHDLLKKGEVQVRGAIPLASLSQATAAPKLSDNSGIGLVSPGQGRTEYFTTLSQQKIVRRTSLIYNRAIEALEAPSLPQLEPSSALERKE